MERGADGAPLAGAPLAGTPLAGAPLTDAALAGAQFSAMRDVQPVVLEGAHVRLEPLGLEHLDALCAVGLDPELWRLQVSNVRTPADMRAYVERALRERDEGRALPFVTVHRASGRVAGSTRYANIVPEHRRLEIGWTWLAREFQRTAVNTEAKYLMLRHAFETLGAYRVELKTDALNAQSRAAILRIGAREEGTLRKHSITFSGRARDTVYFAITDDDWPEVKARLEGMLARSR